MEFEKRAGRHCGDIRLFALSTCVWCKKTKALLEELGIEFEFVFVDLLEGADRAEALELLDEWNPRRSFPTMVVDSSRAIIGFDEAAIRGLAKDV